MKKLLFSLVIFLFCGTLFAQVPDQRFFYSQIVGTEKFLSTKVNIQLDFGQSVKYFADNRFKDPLTGKPVQFNSMIDALNFMVADGWEFVQAFVTNFDEQREFHYMLRKDLDNFTPEEQQEILKPAPVGKI